MTAIDLAKGEAQLKERRVLLAKLTLAERAVLAAAPLHVLRELTRSRVHASTTVTGRPQEHFDDPPAAPSARANAEMDKRMGVAATAHSSAIHDTGTRVVFGTMRPSEARAHLSARREVRASSASPEANEIGRRMGMVTAAAPAIDLRGATVVFATLRPNQAAGVLNSNARKNGV